MELDKKIKPQGVTVSFRVPTEAPPLDLNIHEEVVGTSTKWSNILNKMIMKLAMILMMIYSLKENRILLKMLTKTSND